MNINSFLLQFVINVNLGRYLLNLLADLSKPSDSGAHHNYLW
jgi:hypothetical protein